MFIRKFLAAAAALLFDAVTADEKKEVDSMPELIAYGYAIDLSAKLGSGSYATVYRGLLGERSVAIKSVKTAPRDDKYFSSNELGLMKLLTHLRAPHVVQLLAYTAATVPYFLILPIMENGSLHSHIENAAAPPFSLSLRFRIVSSVAAGLAYLHKLLIIHSDLKPENILLDKDNVPYISDFDMALQLNPETQICPVDAATIRGTPIYMAPEIFLTQNYSMRSDVYAFAILLWETLAWKFAGENVFSKAIPLSLSFALVLGGHREKIPNDLPQDIARLITFGWEHDEMLRPSMQDMHVHLAKNAATMNRSA